MHLKNFALLRRDDGMVGLSPAYDLVSTRMVISARNDPEELALPVHGRKRKLTRKDFLALGEALELPPVVIERAFARLARTAPKLLGHIGKSFLPAPLQAEYADLITARLKRLAS
jgi:serine/threonine-protein kinase HipA